MNKNCTPSKSEIVYLVRLTSFFYFNKWVLRYIIITHSSVTLGIPIIVAEHSYNSFISALCVGKKPNILWNC